MMKIKESLIEFSKGKSFMAYSLRFVIKLRGLIHRSIYYAVQTRKPIKKNKIVFMCHHGKQYACNPMYICEYLMEKYPNRFDLVWAFRIPENFKYLEKKGIRVIGYNTKEHIKEMADAAVIITNVDTFRYVKNRQGQMILDTWHGGGSYKTCGFANAQNLNYFVKRVGFKLLYSKINLYMSSSKAFSEQTIRWSRAYKGEILEVGMPRNDILVNQNRPEINDKVRAFFGLLPEDKIVLYAPTFRSEKEQSEFEPPDFERLAGALARRFGGNWKVLYRQHHFYEEKQDLLSATAYPDMQELLYTADVLVTDYSSSIWDFSLMYKPVFLYCPDLSQYKSTRDFYLPIEKWPFYLCTSNADMEDKIIHYDREYYIKQVRAHHELLGNCETGRATEIICERIAKHCKCLQSS